MLRRILVQFYEETMSFSALLIAAVAGLAPGLAAAAPVEIF
jgi:hypothetical protein